MIVIIIYSSIKEGGCFTSSVYVACRKLIFLLKGLLTPIFPLILEMAFYQHFHLCHHYVENYRIYHVFTCFFKNEAFDHLTHFNLKQPLIFQTFALNFYTIPATLLNRDNLCRRNTPKKSTIHLREEPYFLF